jgi:hypothetical protein
MGVESIMGLKTHALGHGVKSMIKKTVLKTPQGILKSQTGAPNWGRFCGRKVERGI